MQKDPNYQPDLIQSGIPNTLKLSDKLFFHPEVLILLTYFIYFSYYFFRLTIKSKKVS